MQRNLIAVAAACAALAACGTLSEGEAGTTTIRPYGEWESPISAADLVVGTRGFSEPTVDDGLLYWRESRPEEGGRYVIMRRDADGAITEITPADFNVRTRVQEYGGGAFIVAGGVVYFSNFDDQRLYRQTPGEAPVAITPASGSDLRYADCVFDARRARLICVREDHRGEGQAVNGLVALDPEGEGAGQVLFAETDFVASPRISPEGTRLAFVSWMLPNMPWDSVQLRIGRIAADGGLDDVTLVNPDQDEAVLTPAWGPDGALYALTDRQGAWGLFRLEADGLAPVVVEDFEIGLPLWVFDRGIFDFLADGRIVAVTNRGGEEGLIRIDPATGAWERLATPVVDVDGLTADGETVYAAGGFRDRDSALIAVNAASGAMDIVRTSGGEELAPDFISVAEAVSYPTGSGETSHGFYYPPTNPRFVAPEGATPPLIVLVHGGPTSHATPMLSLRLQYWTTRGFAVLDVNYRGSTGFGRAYRRRLYGDWGVTDVEDAVNGALYLAETGRADRDRLIIRGGSAGGYTTLAAHAFYDVFATGASYYGVSDLEALEVETHKFESRYLDELIGPYPERRDLFVERSPIHHLDGFTRPLILFQGLDDKIVPPNQAERIYDALKSRGVPTAYLAFEGEQHGFRKAETVIRSLEAELYFYGRVLGFEPADDIEPIPIDNLD